MVLLLGCARQVFDMQLENKVVTSGPSPQEFTIKIKSWAHSDAELNQFFISKKQHDQQLPNGNNGAGRNNRSQENNQKLKIKDDNTHRFCDVIPDQRYMRKLNGRLVDEMMTLVFISYQ
ncbi:unnamed protein product [Rhizophagus irregularis]|nr:unnamed protein product [Rhizophagus irregularis]